MILVSLFSKKIECSLYKLALILLRKYSSILFKKVIKNKIATHQSKLWNEAVNATKDNHYLLAKSLIKKDYHFPILQN